MRARLNSAIILSGSSHLGVVLVRANEKPCGFVFDHICHLSSPDVLWSHFDVVSSIRCRSTIWMPRSTCLSSTSEALAAAIVDAYKNGFSRGGLDSDDKRQRESK